MGCRRAGLTQRDLRLHGHGQRWVLDLTTEEGLIVDLRVEGPGEQGPHLHRAIAAWGAAVAQEVDRLGAVYPTGELAAHHCLRDVFRGGLHEETGVLGEAARGALRVGTSSPVFSVQEGQGLLHFGVVHVPMQKATEGPTVLQGSRAGCGQF